MTLGKLTELAKVTGGTWGRGIAAPVGSFSGISNNTRTLGKGDVFFCLKGEAADGHTFAHKAAARGAAAIVARRGRPGFAGSISGVPVLRVDDPLEAMCAWAEAHRRKFDLPFVAVTGSVGKTSTKEMIASVLACKYTTFKSPGNYNNRIGLPLAVQRLTPRFRMGVVEMGMSSPGEIARLTKMIQPEIGVITWIGPAHLEFFKDIREIARAKRELFDQMAPPGIGVVNLDNPILARWYKGAKRKMVGYSIKKEADIFATNIRHLPQGTSFRLNGKTLIKLRAIGDHVVSNALAACAVGQILGIGVEKIRDGLWRTPLPEGRLTIKKARSITILDDTYNSNPISAKAALAALCALRPSGKTIACLGAMRELGVSARQLHKEVGRTAVAQGVDGLFGVGYWGYFIIAGANENPGNTVTMGLRNLADAAEWLIEYTQPGDAVLFKASRAVGFDRLVSTFIAGKVVSNN